MVTSLHMLRRIHLQHQDQSQLHLHEACPCLSVHVFSCRLSLSLSLTVICLSYCHISSLSWCQHDSMMVSFVAPLPAADILLLLWDVWSRLPRGVRIPVQLLHPWRHTSKFGTAYFAPTPKNPDPRSAPGEWCVTVCGIVGRVFRRCPQCAL